MKPGRMKGIQKSKMNRADYVRRVLKANGVRTPEEMKAAMERLGVLPPQSDMPTVPPRGRRD